MHSSRRFKGKLTERWGRKASGLRDVCAYDSGVADRTLTYFRPLTQAGVRRFDRLVALHISPRVGCASVSKVLGQGEARIVEPDFRGRGAS